MTDPEIMSSIQVDMETTTAESM